MATSIYSLWRVIDDKRLSFLISPAASVKRICTGNTWPQDSLLQSRKVTFWLILVFQYHLFSSFTNSNGSASQEEEENQKASTKKTSTHTATQRRSQKVWACRCLGVNITLDNCWPTVPPHGMRMMRMEVVRGWSQAMTNRKIQLIIVEV